MIWVYAPQVTLFYVWLHSKRFSSRSLKIFDRVWSIEVWKNSSSLWELLLHIKKFSIFQWYIWFLHCCYYNHDLLANACCWQLLLMITILVHLGCSENKVTIPRKDKRLASVSADQSCKRLRKEFSRVNITRPEMGKQNIQDMYKDRDLFGLYYFVKRNEKKRNEIRWDRTKLKE